MKKIIQWAGILCSIVTLASCSVDNYEQPNATLQGQAIDKETGELILQDIGENGSKIEIIEQGYATQTSQYLHFKTDGTYCDQGFFEGTYLIRATQANFVPLDEDAIITVKGTTVFDFETLPYCRIAVDSIGFNSKKQQVWASFRVERTLDEKLKTVRLFCDQNPNVSLSMNTYGDNACRLDVDAYNLASQTFVLKMDVDGLEDGEEYWFRIGALSNAAQARYNYAPAVKLKIVKGEKEEEPEDKTPGIAIDECNSASGWASSCGDVAVDKLDYKSGTGSLSVTSPSAGVHVFFQKGIDPPIDFSKAMPFSGAHLLLTMYVSDPSHFYMNDSAEIEITSSGGPDVNEIAWTFDKFTLEEGWNVLDLPFATGNVRGTVDFSSINFFRFWALDKDGNTTIKLDDIRIYYPTLMDGCEVLDDWKTGIGPLTIDEIDYKEGEGCISVTGDAVGGIYYMKTYPKPYPSGLTLDNGWLKCWIYISDGPLFNECAGNQFELSSSGAFDVNELGWGFPALENGWNLLKFRFSDAMKTGGDIDLNNLNFIRVWNIGPTGPITMKMDAIRLYEDGFEPEE